MKITLIAVFAGLLCGCVMGPSGHWVQAGRTDQEAQDDLCALSESGHAGI
jgi:hypothetical protein